MVEAPDTFGEASSDFWILHLGKRVCEIRWNCWAVLEQPSDRPMAEDIDGESQTDYVLKTGHIFLVSRDFQLCNGMYLWEPVYVLNGCLAADQRGNEYWEAVRDVE
jgi:hypothetical protein